MSRQKTPYKRKLKGRIAVLGEGRTEQFYLKHLKGIKGYSYAIRPSLFDSITIEDAGKTIQELLDDEYALVVFFTDYDTVVNQQKQVEFNALKKIFLDNPNVIICESMPSIEFWFLLHFTKSTRNFENAKQVFTSWQRHMKNYDKKAS